MKKKPKQDQTQTYKAIMHTLGVYISSIVQLCCYIISV